MSLGKEEQFREKLTYEFQIHDQIKKCRKAFTENLRDAIVELRVLEEMLFPYLDKDTREKLATINNVIKNDEIALLELLFMKFRTLIVFLDAQGLLLEKQQLLEV